MRKQRKTKAQIAIMAEGGRKLARIRRALVKRAKPGVTPFELDSLAEELIAKEGGQPSFKLVPRYNWATCICPNEVVVHGTPDDRPLVNGDIVGIDVGFYFRGFHTDTAETVMIKGEEHKTGNSRKKKFDRIEAFLATGRKALAKAIDKAVIGNHIGHISRAIQEIIERQGFNVVHNLVGHGIGRQLHEWPEVPGILARPIKETPKLEAGMTLAIEVIYTMGKSEITISSGNDWTVVTKDGSLSGLFEHTVLVGQIPRVLTL